MKVLLVKPRHLAAHFGLAPFFRTEPLGLEYISAALTARGHQVRIVDMCFERRSMKRILRSFRPQLVGISCLHILDVEATLHHVREIKRTVLNAAGRKKWWQWLPQVDLRHVGHMARILIRSQQLMNPRAYLDEARIPADAE
jgi:hypothetical protein